MKLVSFTHNNAPSYGILNGDNITDLGQRLDDSYPDLKSLIAAGIDKAALVEQTADLQLEEVELLPTIPNPDVIWCAGMNTHSHFEEAKGHLGMDEEPNTPMFFLRAMAHINPEHVGSGVKQLLDDLGR